MDVDKKVSVVDKIIAVFYHIIGVDYSFAYLFAIVGGKFGILLTIFSIIQVSLLILSGQGLWRGKRWGKSIALLTSLLVIFPTLIRIVTKGLYDATVWKIFIFCIFSCLSIYMIISMLKITSDKEKRKRKFCKHCGEKLAIDVNVCTYCGRELSEEDTISP